MGERFSEIVCVNCGDPLNVRAGELPFFVRDDAGDGRGKNEAWCPQCFVWHRAPLEPERFQPYRPHTNFGGYRAIRCTRPGCALTTVDTGARACSQCGERRVLDLPAKPYAGVKGWTPKVLRTAGLVAPRPN